MLIVAAVLALLIGAAAGLLALGMSFNQALLLLQVTIALFIFAGVCGIWRIVYLIERAQKDQRERESNGNRRQFNRQVEQPPPPPTYQ